MRFAWRAFHRVVWGPLLVGVVAAGCSKTERAPYSTDDSSGTPESEIPYERLPETSEAFVESDCKHGIAPYVSQCGTVTVPEGPGSSRSIELAVRRVFSNAKTVQEDPVVYLNGGPGGSTLDQAAFYVGVFAPLLESRDLILVDQRGTGASKPSLGCSETEADPDAALDACYARLSKLTDLSNTTTVSNAADHELLRQAFGYVSWNLYGISYGTRLGLTIARDFPAGVRSLVLDSVVPLESDLIAGLAINGQTALEVAFAACLEDSACAAKYPDSMTQLLAVVNSLDATPHLDPAFDGQAFVNVLFQTMYNPEGVSLVPYLIDAASKGNYDKFSLLLQGSGAASISFGMHLSLHCAEEVPFTTPDLVAKADAQVHTEIRAALSGAKYLDYCAHWPVNVAPASENEPALSDVPTLVMSGKFDPVTPPKNALLVANELAHAQYFELSDQSHGASTGDCGMSLVRQFFDDPNVPVPVGCSGSLPPLAFQGHGARGQSSKIGGKVDFVLEEPTAAEWERLVRRVERRFQ